MNKGKLEYRAVSDKGDNLFKGDNFYTAIAEALRYVMVNGKHATSILEARETRDNDEDTKLYTTEVSVDNNGTVSIKRPVIFTNKNGKWSSM